jgi:uncharacterized protein (TIGR04222 family)
MNAIWQRLSAHSLEFLAHKLCAEQGWSPAEAREAIEEYRRFCLLAATATAASRAIPSDAVDQVWHLHLTFTRDYWLRFCPEALGTDLHHEPGPADAAMRERYAETLARYAETFGPPPARWWPGTRERFAGRKASKRRILPRRRAWPVLLVLAPAAALALGPNPLNWPGPNFLGLYVVLMAAGFAITRLWRRALRETNQPDMPVQLNPFEAALLAGGRARVIDVAVTELLAQGHASWDDKKDRFEVTQGAPAPTDPLLAGVLALMRQSPRPPLSPRKVAALFAPLEARLRSRGLWLEEAQARTVAWRPALIGLALVLFGAAKLAIGLSLGRPIAFLVFLMIVTFFATLGMALNHPQRSRAGDRLLEDLQLSRNHSVRAPRQADLALAVALAGTVVLADTAYAGYHQRMRGGGGDGSSDGSGGGSGGDCGGGGGSGCGGCGGGGD